MTTPAMHRASLFVGACAVTAALISGMALIPLLLAIGAFVTAAALAGGLAGLIVTPATAWLTYRWAVADAARAERRQRRLASFPAIGASLLELPPAAVEQVRAVLEDVTASVEVRR